MWRPWILNLVPQILEVISTIRPLKIIYSLEVTTFGVELTVFTATVNKGQCVVKLIKLVGRHDSEDTNCKRYDQKKRVV